MNRCCLCCDLINKTLQWETGHRKLMKPFDFCCNRDCKTWARLFSTASSIASATKRQSWTTFTNGEAVFFFMFATLLYFVTRSWALFDRDYRRCKWQRLMEMETLWSGRTCSQRWQICIKTGRCCFLQLDGPNSDWLYSRLSLRRRAKSTCKRCHGSA